MAAPAGGFSDNLGGVSVVSLGAAFSPGAFLPYGPGVPVVLFSVEFTGLAAGTSPLDLTPFLSTTGLASGGSPVPATLASGSAEITAGAVPEPHTALLALIGVSLAWFSHKKRR